MEITMILSERCNHQDQSRAVLKEALAEAGLTSVEVKETVIRGFITQLPRQFEVAQDNVVLQGVIADIDEENGKAKAIRRLRIHWENNH